MSDTNWRALEIAVGSVAGRLHRKLGRPNQDAVCVARTATGAVLVVCDGCGSAPRSEVGAALGARLVAHALASRAGGGDAPVALDAALFAAAIDEVVARLASLGAAMAGDPTTVAL